MSRSASFLAFSCVHTPFQDNEAIEWLVGQISKRKPDVIVHLGDGHDAAAASRFNDETLHTLLDEFDQHNEILAMIRKASPKSRRIFLPGNHDWNITAPARLDKRIRDICDYRRHEPELEHWDHKVKYVYDRINGCFRLGQVVFAHGYEAGTNAGEFESIYFANEYGLYVHGHTHRPTPEGNAIRAERTKNRPLRYWYANAGCMRDLKPNYMTKKRTENWGQAIVVGNAKLTKSPRHKRCWDAETIWFRSYEDWSSRA